MTLNYYSECATQFLQSYLPRNYHQWEIEFVSTKKLAGKCYLQRKIIQLSSNLIEHSNFCQVEDVLKHEIAHAIAYTYFNYADHGDFWKYLCYNIGCSGDLYAKYTQTVIQKPKCLSFNSKI